MIIESKSGALIENSYECQGPPNIFSTLLATDTDGAIATQYVCSSVFVAKCQKIKPILIKILLNIYPFNIIAVFLNLFYL